MLPIGDRPFLAHMLERLATAGVKRVVFSCGYLPDPIVAGFGDMYDGMALEYAVEPRAAGHRRRDPLRDRGPARRRAVLRAQRRRADGRGAGRPDGLPQSRAARARDRDADRGARPDALRPRAHRRRRPVEAFVEKPEPGAEVTLEPPYWINAGAYVLDRWFLDTVPYMQRVNIEREVFPQLVGNGLYAWRCTGYWNDIGTPESYLAANMHVSGRRHRARCRRVGRPRMRPSTAASCTRTP